MIQSVKGFPTEQPTIRLRCANEAALLDRTQEALPAGGYPRCDAMSMVAMGGFGPDDPHDYSSRNKPAGDPSPEEQWVRTDGVFPLRHPQNESSVAEPIQRENSSDVIAPVLNTQPSVGIATPHVFHDTGTGPQPSPSGPTLGRCPRTFGIDRGAVAPAKLHWTQQRYQKQKICEGLVKPADFPLPNAQRAGVNQFPGEQMAGAYRPPSAENLLKPGMVEGPGEETEQPDGRMDPKPSDRRGEIEQPDRREETEPSDRRQTKQPNRREKTEPPDRCEETKQTDRREETEQPDRPERTEPPDRCEEIRLPFQCEEIRLPFQGEEIRLPFQCKEIRLPFRGEEIRLPHRRKGNKELDRREEPEPPDRRGDWYARVPSVCGSQNCFIPDCASLQRT